MSRSASQVDLAGVFGQCPVPTLIIEAKWDMSWNTDKPEQLRQNHPNAKMVMLQESGHSPFADESERFFKTLEGFLTNLRQVPPLQLAAWHRGLAEREQTPRQLVNSLGWGQTSSEKIASAQPAESAAIRRSAIRIMPQSSFSGRGTSRR